MENLMEGTVKWFANDKGYGFIQCDDGKDIFVHYKAIMSEGYKSLTQGQRVQFMIRKGQKGLQADEVKII